MKKSTAELEAEIRTLRSEVQRLRAKLRKRPKPKIPVRKPRRITRGELAKFIKQNKTTKALARYFKVSKSTIRCRSNKALIFEP